MSERVSTFYQIIIIIISFGVFFVYIDLAPHLFFSYFVSYFLSIQYFRSSIWNKTVQNAYNLIRSVRRSVLRKCVMFYTKYLMFKNDII